MAELYRGCTAGPAKNAAVSDRQCMSPSVVAITVNTSSRRSSLVERLDQPRGVRDTRGLGNRCSIP